MTEDLEGFRRRIDACDREIVRAINERLQICGEVGRHKKKHGMEIHMPEREQEVIENILGESRGPCPPEVLEKLFRLLMEAAVSLEQSSGAATE